ncbi:MAG: amino acid carrier protein [Chlamydiota bacterium]|nr:amino acid carrier protein [Chlamydiota bacterium]
MVEVFRVLFYLVEYLENFLWDYLGVPIIVFLGLYLTWLSGFAQVRYFPVIVKRFVSYISVQDNAKGVHPLKVFFASVGGCIGIGNIVGVCTAIQIGGPGALFWVWVTAFIGTMLKYSEVYLGVRYRESQGDRGYRGGPMYYLRRVYSSSFFPSAFAFLLCIYGVEVYQFRVVAQSITDNFDVNLYLVVAILLFLVIFASYGGVRRVGTISSTIIPIFIAVYVFVGGWVIFANIYALPSLLAEVFVTAFTGHAAAGGFLGSSIMMAMSQGIRRGAYTGDVGIGYSSVIHSQSSVEEPEKQASLVIFDMFLDTFVVCTTSILMILVTGVWERPMEASMLVQTALSHYFPYMHYFMPIFLFILGYSTINAYFVVGVNCAEYLSPRYGRKLFYGYATTALIFFSFAETKDALAVMAVVGCLLLLINCYGIFKLRNSINFNM